MSKLTAEQIDACAGIAILYMEPDGKIDNYVERLRAAMDADDANEAEHISAVMLATLVTKISEESMQIAADIWSKAFIIEDAAE